LDEVLESTIRVDGLEVVSSATSFVGNAVGIAVNLYDEHTLAGGVLLIKGDPSLAIRYLVFALVVAKLHVGR
jgi:hypothetical protein